MNAISTPLVMLTDLHANLPALQAVLADAAALGARAVVHCGDAIDFGPHPAEVLDLLAEADVRCVIGNHDELLFREPPADWPEELADHVRWTRGRVSATHRRHVAAWPRQLNLPLAGRHLVVTHYAWAGAEVIHPPATDTPESLDPLFQGAMAPPGAWVLHGHSHRATDVRSRCRYLSPGPAGLNQTSAALATYLVFTPDAMGNLQVERRETSYDAGPLLRDLAGVAASAYVLREFHPRLLASGERCDRTHDTTDSSPSA